MADDKKGFVMAVVDRLGKGKPKGEESSEGDPAEMDDDEAGGVAAGEELAAAIKSGDGKEIYEAFKALKDLC